ncbi:nucleoside phosphorylase domain-containing protein [Aspergillus avenaceus]|uniref:Nucleoside phosphorylase domain-containing protein n=1 Tax=Aspergillus avenaceus TaxID=36643 RepID=A0A5N6TVK5_ASPAV|nr:nucleoside phosphorylase domain-containing protein [Aspergillus avenaceus]
MFPAPSNIKICIICALKLEADAVTSLLDTTYPMNPYHDKESQRRQRSSLPSRRNNTLQLAILVGICGAIPKHHNGRHIMLGDIIISKSVTEYSLGTLLPGYKNNLSANHNPSTLNFKTLASDLEKSYHSLETQTSAYLHKTQHSTIHPSAQQILPFHPNYPHKHRHRQTCKSNACFENRVCQDAIASSCDELNCAPQYLLPRYPVHSIRPSIHFGSVASGDIVMKSGVLRDVFAEKEGVVAFEMEAAGVWAYLPCLVVKGVCDYADSHKEKSWQGFAALSAAACAKAVLGVWKPEHEHDGCDEDSYTPDVKP